METINDKGFRSYQFYVQGQKTVHRVSILENATSVMTSCSCNGRQKCVHVLTVLSGSKENLSDESLITQTELLKRLDSTEEGKRIMRKALAFVNPNECPECRSPRISKLAVILRAFYGVLYSRNARYRCASCGLLW